MMSELFKIALSLSLSGAAMILIVLLFGKLFRNRISNNWRYYIWLLVVLRLLVPYSPDISVLGTLFQGEAGRSAVDSAPVSQAETSANPDTVLLAAGDCDKVILFHDTVRDEPPLLPSLEAFYVIQTTFIPGEKIAVCIQQGMTERLINVILAAEKQEE